MGSKERYFEGIGRRKTATARVRLTKAARTEIIVNGKNIKDYFVSKLAHQEIVAPLEKIGGTYRITVITKGGGLDAQAEAVRHGIARALVKIDEENRKLLRKLGFLTRDPRMKERKKPGLKRARKAPQWSKR